MTNNQVHMPTWIPILLTPEHEEQAKRMRAERDRQYKNIYEGSATDERWVGDLGEIAFDLWLKTEGIKDFEWLLDDAAGKPDFVTANNARIGVKTVKRKGPPRDHYTAQITARHAKEPIDYFFFMTYEIADRRMWLLGGIDNKSFLEKSRYYSAGEWVHSNYQIPPGHEIFNIEIKELMSPALWINQIK